MTNVHVKEIINDQDSFKIGEIIKHKINRSIILVTSKVVQGSFAGTVLSPRDSICDIGDSITGSVLDYEPFYGKVILNSFK